MRTVSKCQIIIPDPNVYERVLEIVEYWASAKFDETGVVPVIRRSGIDALLTRSDDELEGKQRRIYKVEEAVQGATLHTVFTVLSQADRIATLCSQALVSTALAPPRASIALPRFIADIVQHFPGCAASSSGDRLFHQTFQVNDRGTDEFVDLIFSQERVLPVIAVSELDGKPLTRDFPDRLSDRIAGLAHVCLLSSQASWELTTKFGKDWSVYNGAVKLYWPGANPDASGRTHPFWTYDRLAQWHATDKEAALWLGQRLVELVLEASAYVSEERDFTDFDRERRRLQVTRQMEAAEQADSFRELAQTYADDVEEFKTQIEVLKDEVRELKSKLRVAYSGQQLETLADREDGSEIPPSTVKEAVQVATQTFGDYLTFPDELEASLAGLNASAGPPEKVLRYLRVLKEYAIQLASGSQLGKSVEKWFEDRNVVCSGESLTTSTNPKDQKRRTWRVAGKVVTCNLHLKPSDGTHPDRCVRIYFIPPQNDKVLIGYIGRHFRRDTCRRAAPGISSERISSTPAGINHPP